MAKMYKVEAVIRNSTLEAVRDALKDHNIVGLTVTDGRGAGKHAASSHTFRGSSYGGGLDPRLVLHVAVNEDSLPDAISAIQGAASTGEVGDGKIFVTELVDVISIRTGEKGNVTLS